MLRISLTPIRQARRGIVVPFVALALLGLLGITALAIDGGMLIVDRRDVQTAADAAALAGAIDLYNNWDTNGGTDPNKNAQTSATKTATDNGFTDGTNNVTVVVNIPPKSGPYANTDGFVEVIITMQQQRFFSSVFGSGNITVKGRAVARGAKASSGIGLLVLDPSANNSLHLSATGSVNVTGSVVVDSSSSTGLALTASGTLTASQGVDVTGSSYATSSTGTVNGNLSPNKGSPATIAVSQPVTADPLSTFATNNTPSKVTAQGVGNFGNINLSISSWPPANNSAYTVSGNTLTFKPGYYSGLTINDNMSSSGSPLHTYVMSSGTYYFDGNVTLNGYGSLSSGTGGTLIYINSGQWTNSSQNFTMSVTPMSSGTYANPPLTIWQNKSDSGNFNFSNGGNLTINSGILYVPGALVQLSAKAGTTAQLGSQVIVNTLQLSGSGNFSVDAGQPGTPGRMLYLVE
jgi:hypothetical protein